MSPPNANDPLRTADHQPKPTPASPDVTSDVAPASLSVDGTASDVPGEGTELLAPEPERASGSVAVPGYEIEGVLGRGGMGVVYKARHLTLKRTVALKMVLAGEHAGPHELARFRIEAEAVARLQHPNIVQVFEVGEAGGHPYCALEFVEGGNLAGKIAGKPMPARESARLVESLARAMQLAHSRNVVHRDLKPANVLLAADGTPKITDFGLARRTDSDSGETQAGAVMGTPSYVAPEQASGNAHDAGPAADVYALGAILYDCLAGRPPFKGKTIVETLDQVRTQEPAPPSHWQAGVPLDLETICLKCLRKEPEKRYASAAELADELVRYQQGEPIRARSVGRVERAVKWVRRNPVVTAMAVAVVLALAVGTTVSYLKYLDAEQQKVIALQEADNATRSQQAESSQRQRAELEKKRADVTLADMQTSSGLLAGERDAPAEAALWFAAAADQSATAEDSWRQEANRLRARNWMRQATLPVAAMTLSGGVHQLAFQPRGDLLLVRFGKGEVVFWSWRNSNRLSWAEKLDGVGSAQLSPDGASVALGFLSGEVQIRNVANGELLAKIQH